MTIAIARTLPECRGACGLPARPATLRDGLCRSCRLAAGVPVEPSTDDTAARRQLAEWQTTVARIRADERRTADTRRRNREATRRAR